MSQNYINQILLMHRLRQQTIYREIAALCCELGEIDSQIANLQSQSPAQTALPAIYAVLWRPDGEMAVQHG